VCWPRGSVLQALTPAGWSSSDHHGSGVRGRRLTAMDDRTDDHLERYVCEAVSAPYREARQLTALDFCCLVLWKAHRSKARVANRLLAQGCTALESAAAALTRALATAPEAQESMKLLIDGWGVRLPMASALFTGLFPASCPVYDVRVCEVLGDFQRTPSRTNCEALWDEDQRVIAAVDDAVHRDDDLRDQARWVWGEACCQRFEEDLVSQFRNGRHAHARQR
jgi:hypothetical protein